MQFVESPYSPSTASPFRANGTLVACHRRAPIFWKSPSWRSNVLRWRRCLSMGDDDTTSWDLHISMPWVFHRFAGFMGYMDKCKQVRGQKPFRVGLRDKERVWVFLQYGSMMFFGDMKTSSSCNPTFWRKTNKTGPFPQSQAFWIHWSTR